MDFQNNTTKKLFFTDIDGTLVDQKMNFHKSEKAVTTIKRHSDLIVPVSSKPAGAIYTLLQRMKLNVPFICENGGGIVIPQKYQNKFKQVPHRHIEIPEGLLICLGVQRNKILRDLDNIENKISQKYGLPNYFIISPDMPQSSEEIISLQPYFPHWTVEQIREGCSPQKYFDVAFQFKKNVDIKGEIKNEVISELQARGHTVLKGGLFYHVLKGCDKGKAVKKFTQIFVKTHKTRIKTIGVGDGENDLEMLHAVDKGYNVQDQNGKNLLSKFPRIISVPQIGPRGFSWVVKQVYKSP